MPDEQKAVWLAVAGTVSLPLKDFSLLFKYFNVGSVDTSEYDVEICYWHEPPCVGLAQGALSPLPYLTPPEPITRPSCPLSGSGTLHM